MYDCTCSLLQEGALVEDAADAANAAKNEVVDVVSMNAYESNEHDGRQVLHMGSVNVDDPGLMYDPFIVHTVDGSLGKVVKGLDFRHILKEKRGQYMENTRLWFFDAFLAWNRDLQVSSRDHKLANKRKLFWLSGTGGTGKSVVSAVLVMEALRKDNDNKQEYILADLGYKLVGWCVSFFLL